MQRSYNPAITVVIPCFNMAATVATAARSVISQLGPHDRLIVVDDGSTDATQEVLERLKDRKLQTVRQTNKGVSAARNLGASLAATPYVAFLDADDLWLEGSLDCLKSMIISQADSVLYAFGHFRVKPPATTSRLPESLTHALEHFLGSEFIEKYSSHDLVNSSSACIRRDKLEAIGGFPENVRVGEDVGVWLGLALEGDVTVCFGKHAVIARREIGNSKYRPETPFYLAYIDRVLREGSKDREQNEALRRFLFKRGFRIFLGARISGDERLAKDVRALALRNRRGAAPLFWLGSVVQPTSLRLLYRIYRRLKSPIGRSRAYIR